MKGKCSKGKCSKGTCSKGKCSKGKWGCEAILNAGRCIRPRKVKVRTSFEARRDGLGQLGA